MKAELKINAWIICGRKVQAVANWVAMLPLERFRDFAHFL
jgi:hypothetical protein